MEKKTEGLGSYTSSENILDAFGVKVPQDSNTQESSSTEGISSSASERDPKDKVLEIREASSNKTSFQADGETVFSEHDRKREAVQKLLHFLQANETFFALTTISLFPGWFIGSIIMEDIEKNVESPHKMLVLIYLCLLYPLWIVTKIAFYFMLILFRSFVRFGLNTTNESSEGEDDPDTLFQGLYNFHLFLARKKAYILRIIWTCFLTASWSLLHDYVPNTYPKARMNGIRAHLTIILFLAAKFIASFLSYRFFQIISERHHAEKVYLTIFKQVILLGMCGIGGSKVVLFLPASMYEANKFTKENLQRVENAAIDYILRNKLPTALAFQLGLKNDKGVFIRAQMLKQIRTKFKVLKLRKKLKRKDSIRQKKVTAVTEKSTVEFHRSRSLSDEKISLNNAGSTNSVTLGPRSLSIKNFYKLQQGEKKVLEGRKGSPKDFRITRDEIEEQLRFTWGQKLNTNLALEILDEFEKGYLTMQDIEGFVKNVLTERRNLRTTLKDTHYISSQVETFMFWFLFVLALFGSLFIWDVDVSQTWLTISSIILSFSFIFGNSVRALFENLVFLYFVRPYDVGDAVRLDGVVYVVKRVLLQVTELDNVLGEIRIVQNSQMSKLNEVFNLSRSSGFWVVSTYSVDAQNLTEEIVFAIEEVLLALVQKDPETYYNYIRIDYHTFSAPLKVDLKLGLWLRMTQDDFDRWNRAYSKVAFEMLQQLISREIYVYSTYVEFKDSVVTPAV
eukprot:snap_masked-scaffold_5-processed-gene-4.23-mRNA-1 protein AED:1.00 eAED:1.00 QI:0/-1/0/0/-1/1/1/0/733